MAGEMRDRIAQAIALAVGEKNPLEPTLLRDSFYSDAAEAVLNAMRNPTPDMMQVAESFADFVLPDAVGENTPAGRVRELTAAWQKAVDVALHGGVGRNPNL